MSDKILKLSQAQTLYQDLRERIDALPTDSDIPEVPVTDVQVAGTSVLSNGTANVPVANSNTYGVVKVNSGWGIDILQGLSLGSLNGTIRIITSEPSDIKAGNNSLKPLCAAYQDQSVFWGLSKAAGVDLKDDINATVGTYPETSKTAIRTMLGAAAASDIPTVPVQDVQVNGTSVLSSGVANVPLASDNSVGVVRTGGGYGLSMSGNYICIVKAPDSVIPLGIENNRPIVPSNQHISVFYGLAKAAGDSTQSASSNAVGTYTPEASAAIRSMLGAASPNVIAVQDTQPTNSETKVWLPETQAVGVEVPTYEEFQALDNSVVKKTDYATALAAGVVKVNSINGVAITSNGFLALSSPTDEQIKAGTNGANALKPRHQHMATFYGLAKAAGDTTQSQSSNAVGTYTDDAKAAIQTMLGVPGDVQINGMSIVSNGVANIPVCSSSTFGVVKIDANSFGIKINDSGRLFIDTPSATEMKAGVQAYKPITPVTQHTSVFYGLAKAAGDSTQSASSNAVGTYTTEALAAIHTMLGIDPAAIAAQVEIPLVETVTGTTPSITGQPNTRYNCGEVSTLSITPPASGSIDIIFESGSTPTVITVPNTVKWPAWFDATALEADTTYEILITDGVYGSVMTWAT